MIRLDRDALVCDLAETYHVYDMRSLPLQTVATLSAGLRDDSRIKMKAGGMKVKPELIFMAALIDTVEMFRYGFTEDARKRRNPPESIVKALTGDDTNKPKSFRTAEEFEATLKRIRGT